VREVKTKPKTSTKEFNASVIQTPLDGYQLEAKTILLANQRLKNQRTFM